MDSNHPLFDFDSIFYANNLMEKSFNSLSDEVSSAIKEVMNSNYFTFVDPKITSYFEGGIPDQLKGKNKGKQLKKFKMIKSSKIV